MVKLWQVGRGGNSCATAAMGVAAGLRWSGAARPHRGSDVVVIEANSLTTGIARRSEHISVEKSDGPCGMLEGGLKWEDGEVAGRGSEVKRQDH